ncbi:M1 family metallopeptidase [Taibaiella soli]|uniref:Peptidase M1 membrane alanine aminopeptidase domain-containing protein n=1 Tax=Taibaiella soli TaxID=1649169 RepID=A0A2W2A6L2_9BACT|nr:M1 family metallopeptidase [Taibaiella soli]PZF70915.1 hypothetical protein DN068_21040 [Taibaiella soli]
MNLRLLLYFIILGSITANAQSTYWQQEVNTRIDVRLDDKKHFLHGYEEFTYINHSPDTIKYLYIHLWPNAYKNDRTAFSEQQVTNGQTAFYFAKPKDRGYIDSLTFLIDGREADYYSEPNVPDVARIDLLQPLPPGGQIKVTTPFRVKIPKVFSRMGHTGHAYYISQWFPKPAVYDQKGWHPIPYLDQGEFYSNFGSYDVSITLPKNYVVMATGNYTDESEINWLDSLSKVPFPSDTLYRKSWPKSSDVSKTIHFHEDNIHDFAWFADMRFIVRKDTVTLPGSSNAITAYTAFLPIHREQWMKGTDNLKSTLRHYNTYVGPYPYKTVKAAEGDMLAGGGMEYPTVTLIDRNATYFLSSVLVHEVGHNWFYGMLATNERDHPWMDEGINSYYERKTSGDISRDVESRKENKKNDVMENLVYYESVANRTDQPSNLSAPEYTRQNYGGDVYFKNALLLSWLEQYMGRDSFNAAMQDYFNQWQFKHPYPEDFRAIFEKHSTKPINWFFDEAMITKQPFDYKINHVERAGDSTVVTVTNKSDITAPVRINAYTHDSLIASTWSAPFRGKTQLALPPSASGWTHIDVSKEIPELNLTNSEYRRRGLMHRSGVQFGLGSGINLDYKERVYLLPALGYNEYDHFQLGLLFHNLGWPDKRFKFAVAPMYAFGSKSFTGTGTAAYSWFPKATFKEIILQADAKSFHYNETEQNIPDPLYSRYIKVAPSLNFIFREKNALSPVVRTLTLKGYAISEDYFDYKMDPTDSLYKPSVKNQMKYYGLLRYKHENRRTINPFNYSIEGQVGADFVKINLEGNLRIDYNKKNKSLYVRGYFGKFFAISNDEYAASRYYLNSTFTGANDYLYDDTYEGRSERDGFGGRQISIREGGFKIPTSFQNPIIGRSDNWLASLNLKTDLPLGKLPIRLFADMGTFANASLQNPSGNKYLFDGGVEVYLPFADMVSVYIPLVMSKDFSDYLKSIYGDKRFGKSIVFSLNLQHINWLKAPRKAMNMIL